MTYQNLKVSSLCIVLSLGLAACDSGSGSGSSGNNPTVTPASLDGGNNSNTNATPTDGGNSSGAAGNDRTGMLDGTWVSICDYGDISTITVSGNASTTTSTEYLDDECTVLDTEAGTSSVTHLLEFPQGTTETSLGTAYWLNAIPQTISDNGIPLTADQIQLVQSAGGFSPTYEIYLIGSDGRLYGGDDDFDGALETPANRPTQIDTEYYFVRQ